MFAVICPKCEKLLNLPDTKLGKHVRCGGCQAIVLASTEPVVSAAVPPPLRRTAQPPVPQPPVFDEEPVEEPVEERIDGPVPDAIPGLQCPSCGSAAVVELPANANSRNPGYVCAMCRTEMRQPGGVGNYYAAVLLGTVIALLGVGLAVVALEAKQGRDKMIGGAAALAVLGSVVAGWSFQQTRLPVPIGAETPPSRLGFWVAIFLIGFLLAGGGIFGLMYLMHAMI